MSDLVVVLEDTSPRYAGIKDVDLLRDIIMDKFILSSLKSIVYLILSGRMVHVQFANTPKKPLAVDPVLILRKDVAERIHATFRNQLEFFVSASVLPFIPSLMASLRPFPSNLLSPSEVVRELQGKRQEPPLVELIRQTTRWCADSDEPMKCKKRTKELAPIQFDKGIVNAFLRA